MGALVGKPLRPPSTSVTTSTPSYNKKLYEEPYSDDVAVNRAAKHYATMLLEDVIGEKRHIEVKAAIAEAQQKAERDINGADATVYYERAARILRSKTRRLRRRQRKKRPKKRSNEDEVDEDEGQRPSEMGQIR